jgi:hypothetical protein
VRPMEQSSKYLSGGSWWARSIQQHQTRQGGKDAGTTN